MPTYLWDENLNICGCKLVWVYWVFMSRASLFWFDRFRISWCFQRLRSTNFTRTRLKLIKYKCAIVHFFTSEQINWPFYIMYQYLRVWKYYKLPTFQHVDMTQVRIPLDFLVLVCTSNLHRRIASVKPNKLEIAIRQFASFVIIVLVLLGIISLNLRP